MTFRITCRNNIKMWVVVRKRMLTHAIFPVLSVQRDRIHALYNGRRHCHLHFLRAAILCICVSPPWVPPAVTATHFDRSIGQYSLQSKHTWYIALTFMQINRIVMFQNPSGTNQHNDLGYKYYFPLFYSPFLVGLSVCPHSRASLTTLLTFALRLTFLILIRFFLYCALCIFLIFVRPNLAQISFHHLCYFSVFIRVRISLQILDKIVINFTLKYRYFGTYVDI